MQVHPDDIVVTVDVNLFPMTPHLLDPILTNPQVSSDHSRNPVVTF